MADPTHQEIERTLELRLQVSGLVSGLELARQTALSQSVVSRTLRGMGPRVVRVGDRRTTRWGLTRNVRHIGSSWSVYRIGPDGQPAAFGILTAFHGGFLFDPTPPGARWLSRIEELPVFAGLPFFLSDVRPQGFIGRMIGRAMPARLGLPADIRRWQDDDVLSYLHEFGSEIPGDLIVGDTMINQALRDPGQERIALNARLTSYADLANRTMAGEQPGSSAGGEQPKFSAWIEHDGDIIEMLVKFSPPRETPPGRRWSDLLVSEQVANEILASAGFNVSRTDLLQSEARTFLESRRFDRVGTHGRRGVLTAEAVGAAYLGAADLGWSELARRLEAMQLLSASDASRIQVLHWFGHLIGNTDMHAGNLAFLTDPALPSLVPAPVYDMLPMLFAPQASGEMTARRFLPPPPLPADMTSARAALPLAMRYWETIAADARVTPEFRADVAECLRALRDWSARFGS